MIRALNCSAGRYAFSVTGLVLFVILVFDVALLGFSSYSILCELEKYVVPLFTSFPVRAASPAIVRKKTGKVHKVVPPVPADVRIDIVSDAAGVFGRYGGVCGSGVVAGPFSGVTLEYDVAAPASVAGYSCALDRYDLNGEGKLQLRIRGETGDEVFKIGVGGKDVNCISSHRFFPDGFSAKWQEITVPLAGFSGGNAEWAPEQLLITFEHAQGMPYSGRIFVGDVRFVK